MAGKRDPEMQEFWASLPPKIKASLWVEGRRLVLSSDEVPLHFVHQSRYKSQPKFYLFTDAFVIVQGSTITEHPLEEIWMEHIVPVEGILHSIHNISSFRLVLPESSLELQCKELAHKSKWVSTIAEALGTALNLSQFISGRGDLNLDTQLELLRSREYFEYTFRSTPEYKDGRYRGPWKNGKPHGRGEFSQETTGRLYKGSFWEGKFHGEGEMLWFSDKDARKKYIGEFRNGEVDGHGEMKYSNGDVYSGHWVKSQRSGFGRLEETSRKSSLYAGAWENDKRHGYGVYEDKMKHERYLGMWADDLRCGPGMIVSSTGTYCEATFASGTIASGHDGFVIDPNGRSFMGRLSADLKLCGKGLLTLTNGTTIEGSFSGYWHKRIEINRGLLEDGERYKETADTIKAVMAELQIAKLDKRIGNCTVLACNKWQPIFSECEAALGFSGDAANDVMSAWSKLARDTFQTKGESSTKQVLAERRSNSLQGMYGRNVKMPVDLIPLERARALTSIAPVLSNETVVVQNASLRSKRFLSQSSDSLCACSHPKSKSQPEISEPLNLEESVYTAHLSRDPLTISSSPYAPQADANPLSMSRRPHSDPEDSMSSCVSEDTLQAESQDTKATIQAYTDKAFSNPRHPLGILMNRLEMVYHASYGGIGANKYLLPHAIAETHSLIKRIHTIVRILFPLLGGEDKNVSQFGIQKIEGFSDPDDYLAIESGYGLLHPLVFLRLFPTLITLYVLQHDESDQKYQRGLFFLKQMDDDRLVHFIRFQDKICRKVAGREADGDILKSLDNASNTLRVINTLFTPGEFLEHFKNAFKELESIEQLSGDFLLPAVVFILVRANVPHLGAYLHFLTDFAHTQPEDEYTLVTYEAAYNFIRNNAPGISS